ncbi:hypothetical protein [Paraburkholderia sp. MM5482-R1]|uniref:hypothetical protein n=1 Tax=unclassified Paraburkholderia TaxID=2615204 RepID=UPI003D1ED6AB
MDLDGDVLNAFAGKGSKAASVHRLVERTEHNEFDLIAVGRALIGDPNWVMKIQAGAHATCRALMPPHWARSSDPNATLIEDDNRPFSNIGRLYLTSSGSRSDIRLSARFKVPERQVEPMRRVIGVEGVWKAGRFVSRSTVQRASVNLSRSNCHQTVRAPYTRKLRSKRAGGADPATDDEVAAAPVDAN